MNNLKKNTLRIAGIQTNIIWEDKQGNFSNIQKIIDSNEKQYDLIILPETFSTGFTMRSETYAERQYEESETFLLEIAQKTKSLVGGSWIEYNPNGKPFNTFSIASNNGKIISRYSKIHPFSYAGEDKAFTPGTKTFTFEFNGFNICPLVCYDVRFPELFRKTAGLTDFYIVVANWPAERIEHWLALLKARALENQAFVLGVNRVGQAGRRKFLQHNGYSGLFRPSGKSEILDSEKEEILDTEITLEELMEIRNKFQYLKDRKLK